MSIPPSSLLLLFIHSKNLCRLSLSLSSGLSIEIINTGCLPSSLSWVNCLCSMIISDLMTKTILIYRCSIRAHHLLALTYQSKTKNHCIFFSFLFFSFLFIRSPHRLLFHFIFKQSYAFNTSGKFFIMPSFTFRICSGLLTASLFFPLNSI